jgi:hypothetical protein
LILGDWIDGCYEEWEVQRPGRLHVPALDRIALAAWWLVADQEG